MDLQTAIKLVPECKELVNLNSQEKLHKFRIVEKLLKEKNAVMITHYYADDLLQELTEFTGGFIGDSLEMARFGVQNPAGTLLVTGVHFMAETAKILSPEKFILVPDLAATCSMDMGCPVEAFSAFCDANPDRTVVVYANTSAAVKARADWVVTSSIAVPLIEDLKNRGEKILWAPDKHLGHYLQTKTGADMLLWNGACIVHEAFKAKALMQLKAQYPDAAVLVHPEAPAEVLTFADVIGSTSQLIKAAKSLPHSVCIVGTEQGIFYKMRQAAPEKEFILAPTGGNGATCKSCAHCPWMKLNSLEKILNVLQTSDNVVHLSMDLIQAARKPLDRMLKFSSQR